MRRERRERAKRWEVAMEMENGWMGKKWIQGKGLEGDEGEEKGLKWGECFRKETDEIEILKDRLRWRGEQL